MSRRSQALCWGSLGRRAPRIHSVRVAKAPLAFHAHAAPVGPHRLSGKLGKRRPACSPRPTRPFPRSPCPGEGTCSLERVLPLPSLPLPPPHTHTSPGRGGCPGAQPALWKHAATNVNTAICAPACPAVNGGGGEAPHGRLRFCGSQGKGVRALLRSGSEAGSAAAAFRPLLRLLLPSDAGTGSQP